MYRDMTKNSTIAPTLVENTLVAAYATREGEKHRPPWPVKGTFRPFFGGSPGGVLTV
jgi:hypothetical protein